MRVDNLFKLKYLHRNIIAMFVALSVVGLFPILTEDVSAQSKAKTTATAKKSGGVKKTTTSTKKKTSAKKSAKGKRTTAKKETSADVKKKEQAAQKEIKLTQQQIEANEKEVKTNLSLLTEIGSGIEKSRQQVATLAGRAATLEQEIADCNTRIEASEKRIETLRAKYLQAVKKMRVARKKTSTLAFIFSSKNFYQAWRRLRYMREFSDWRERQVRTLRSEIDTLNATTKLLADKKAELEGNLDKQLVVKQELETKYARQDEVVTKLKANGDALRSHLAKKQREAAAMSQRISQLIIAEQQAAEAEKQRKAEQARLAEERRKKEVELAEQRRKEAEAKAKAEAERKEELAKAEVAKDKDKKQADNKKENKKAETSKKAEQTKKSGDKTYADARKRRPRGDTEGKTTGKSESQASAPTPAKSTPTPPKSNVSGFASAKGSLPRPVAGKFTVTSKFGRHELPDLPGVMFDNPGIDALVSPGAHAQAVYAGTVSGIYVLNGFSTVVIVNHGDYYTVYGNIGTPSVKKGDSVKQGQVLGKLVSDPDDGNRTTIHFEVWKNREKQNPEAWIR